MPCLGLPNTNKYIIVTPNPGPVLVVKAPLVPRAQLMFSTVMLHCILVACENKVSFVELPFRFQVLGLGLGFGLRAQVRV